MPRALPSAATGGVAAALVSSFLTDYHHQPAFPVLCQDPNPDRIHWGSLLLGILLGLLLGQVLQFVILAKHYLELHLRYQLGAVGNYLAVKSRVGWVSRIFCCRKCGTCGWTWLLWPIECRCWKASKLHRQFLGLRLLSTTVFLWVLCPIQSPVLLLELLRPLRVQWPLSLCRALQPVNGIWLRSTLTKSAGGLQSLLGGSSPAAWVESTADPPRRWTYLLECTSCAGTSTTPPTIPSRCSPISAAWSPLSSLTVFVGTAFLLAYPAFGRQSWQWEPQG